MYIRANTQTKTKQQTTALQHMRHDGHIRRPRRATTLAELGLAMHNLAVRWEELTEQSLVEAERLRRTL